MASIYQPNGRKVWYIQYYQNGIRVQKSLKTRDKKLAEYKRREIENQIARGAVGLDTPRMPAQSVFDEYIDYCKDRLSPKTVEDYRYTIGKYLRWLGTTPLVHLNDKSLQDYLSGRKTSPHTANRLIQYLTGMMSFAVKRGYITENPFKETERYRVDQSPPKHLSKKQIKAILTASKNETLYFAIAIAIYTGMRLGEIKRLEWSDIDLKRGEIMIRKAKSRRFRTIPIHPQLAKILKAGHGKGAVCSWVNHRRVFKRIARNSVPGLGWHDLRHAFASLLAQNGVSLLTIKEYLGHASLTTTQIYLHLSPDHKKKEINKISF